LGVALSSTAIVLKSLSDRNEVQSLLGNLCTGILLLQDVTVIVVLLLLPFIAPGQGDEGAGDWGAAIEAAGGLALLVAIVLFARKALPFVLVQITRHGGAELTTLFAVTMAAGGAWLAGTMGWPLPLGACVAGLLLAEADLRHQLAAEITPFRDVFNALFFVSLGMLVDLDVVIRHAPVLLLAIVGTLVLKSAITAVAVRSAGWSMRIAVQTGFALCSVSEFAYVLAREAHGVGLLSDGVLQLLIPYAVGTMLIGAILIPLSGPLAARIFKSQEEDGGDAGAHGPGGDYDLSSHVVIVGYGVNGENLVFCTARYGHWLLRGGGKPGTCPARHGGESAHHRGRCDAHEHSAFRRARQRAGAGGGDQRSRGHLPHRGAGPAALPRALHSRAHDVGQPS
jgi:CPA2 family monovalent cation:H+ antiporter-2